MKKGRPRYRIVCDSKDFDEPQVVGFYPPFGFILVEQFDEELKISPKLIKENGANCLVIMRLLRDVKDSLEGADNNSYSNFRIAKIWYDKNTNTQTFETVITAE